MRVCGVLCLGWVAPLDTPYGPLQWKDLAECCSPWPNVTNYIAHCSLQSKDPVPTILWYFVGGHECFCLGCVQLAFPLAADPS